MEGKNIRIKNLENTPYADPTGSFVKQVYVSKIGIYDKDKNLIAIAKLANPVRKTEERDYTFKLKYDF
jgi:N-dimethylarginine dimethylaminohydrolase